MAETTGISWCDRTWSPWIGCQKVSPACDGCYAEHLMDTRLGRVAWGPHGERSRTSAAYWRQPLRWQREAAETGERQLVFPSLCDPFDNQVSTDWWSDWLRLMEATPNLTWLLLTKRPQNILSIFDAAAGVLDDPAYRRKAWPRNAAIGCTVVTQAEADRDIPKLLEAKEALAPPFAFLSMEPLLEAVDMRRWLPQGRLATRVGSGEQFYAPHFYMTKCEHCGWVGSSELCGTDSWGDDSDVYCPACSRSILGDNYAGLDWVITGGETDQGKHKARPSSPQWFRDIRDQSAAAGVAYHHKQNGEWASVSEVEGAGDHFQFPDGRTVRKVGKRAAGRLLDGAVHDARARAA